MFDLGASISVDLLAPFGEVAPEVALGRGVVALFVHDLPEVVEQPIHGLQRIGALELDERRCESPSV